MKKTALVIMAAGIGSRYGGGIKQLAAVDPKGHIIMDYSIHDAIEAGFNQIVFIIRRDIEEDFRKIIGERIERVCNRVGVEVSYCFQALDEIPGALPVGRKKPWGTGQAVLAARELVNCPFAVLNADDYYGKQAFAQIHDFLCSDHTENAFCMAGFVLENTLSENGGVTRGVCHMDDSGYLTDVVETRGIVKTPHGACVGDRILDSKSLVSMNMWGLSTGFMDTLDRYFRIFFATDVPANPLGAEYLLPTLIGKLLQEKAVTVKVLPTSDKWFGVTYAEDRESVTESFCQLLQAGVYAEDLYTDL